MKTTTQSPFIFTPTEAGTVTEVYLKKRIDAVRSGELAAGVPLYIRGIDAEGNNDDGFLPLVGGELFSILARPGHGKTSFMMRLARRRARDIQEKAATGSQDAAKRVVVYATLEQTVEELSTFHIAAESKISITKMGRGLVTDGQWIEMEGILARRMSSPLWFIGYGGGRKTKARMDLQALEDALDEIQNWNDGNIIDLVFVDYLQRIPYRDESKVIGISNNLDELKRFCLSRGIPAICGVQAGRDVDKRDDPTPLLEDGQWTSNIEQTSDKVASIVRPCQYKAQGETFGSEGVIVEGHNQMCVSVLKQKLGQANFRKWLDFDPRFNELASNELRNILPEND